MNEEEKAAEQRKAFWMNVYIAVAASSNCVEKHIPGVWADRALTEFDKRFNTNKS